MCVCVCVCVCVRFQHQLALDHPQEERRHSRTPLTPSAPLGQLPSQLKDHLRLRIHHGKVWAQCAPVNNNSHALYRNVWMCAHVCVWARAVCECRPATLKIVKARWIGALQWPMKKQYTFYEWNHLFIWNYTLDWLGLKIGFQVSQWSCLSLLRLVLRWKPCALTWHCLL